MKKLILTLQLTLFLVMAGFTQNIPYPVIPDWESTPLGMVSTGLGLADINGDGWKDIIVANGNDMQRQHLVVYYNQGDGSFPHEPDWESQDIDYHGHLAVGDLNADGWPDVAVSVYIGPSGFSSPGKLKIYYNLGGELEQTPSFVSEEFYTFSCAMGDADGDGDLDIATTAGESYSSINEPARIFYNNNGTFSTTAEWNSALLFSPLDVDFGDIDHNGKLDLVFASERWPCFIYLASNTGEIDNAYDWETSENPLYMNSLDIGTIGQQETTGIVFSGNNQLGGEGKIKLYTFTEEIPPESSPVWSSTQAGYWSGILLHDVDLDGINDLIYGGWWLPLKVHLGNEENFEQATSFTSQTSSVVEAIQIADLNKDGMEEQLERFGITEQSHSVFYLSHPIEFVLNVIISDASIGPEYYCYVPGKNWLSINSDYIVPGDTVFIRYQYSRKGDMVITNWDNSKGNYIFYNDTIITSAPDETVTTTGFNLFPNPASGYVMISLNYPTQESTTITINDINGKPAGSGAYTLKKGERIMKINLDNFATGIYMILLVNDHFTKTKKLIIR
jgi:hypothetical protein